MDASLNRCQVSTGHEQDWKDLYNTSFPADERTPLEELQRLLDSGSILLHRTTNKAGELLCFSIVYPMSNFALLSYIASDSTKRSTGIGSKHMKRLLELLKSKYPEFLGLVLEIESTRQVGLDAADKTARQRRLAFYQRLGAKRLCRTYVWPSYAQKGSYRLAELMWFDFDPATIDDPHLPGIVKELYMKGYGAQEDDPILEMVIHQFKCSERVGSAAVVCPVEPQASDASKPADTKPAESVTATPSPTPAAADSPSPETTTVVPVADVKLEDAPVADTAQKTDNKPKSKRTPRKKKSAPTSPDDEVVVTAISLSGEKGGDSTKDGA